MQIICVHGAGESASVWAPQIALISDVRTIELPGHGMAPGPGRDAVELYADWVMERIEGAEPVILAGHSMGGAIALDIALRRPDWLAGVLLVATGARLRVHPDILGALNEDWEAAIDVLCRWAIGPFAEPSVRAGMEESLRRAGPEVTRNDYRGVNDFDVMARLVEIDVPALAITGERDVMTPPRYARYLGEHIPIGGTVLVPGAGHMVTVEQPFVVNEVFEAFRRNLA